MTMEAVTVKFQENILKKIDRTILEHNFNSRTEFIREAVRDKVVSLDRDKLIEEFMKFEGKAKVKLSDEQFKKNREEFSKELRAELEKKFGH